MSTDTPLFLQKKQVFADYVRELCKLDLSDLPVCRDILDGGAWGPKIQAYEDRLSAEWKNEKISAAQFEASVRGWVTGIKNNLQRHREIKDKKVQFAQYLDLVKNKPKEVAAQ